MLALELNRLLGDDDTTIHTPELPTGVKLEAIQMDLADFQGRYAKFLIGCCPFKQGDWITPRKDGTNQISAAAGHPMIVLETGENTLRWDSDGDDASRSDILVGFKNGTGQLGRQWFESFNFEPWVKPGAEG